MRHTSALAGFVLCLSLSAVAPEAKGQITIPCNCDHLKTLFSFTSERAWSNALFSGSGTHIYPIPNSLIDKPEWYWGMSEHWQTGDQYGGAIIFPNYGTFLSYGLPRGTALTLFAEGCLVTVSIEMRNESGEVVRRASTPPGEFVGSTTGLTPDAARLMTQRGATIHNRGGITFPSSGTLCATLTINGTPCPVGCVLFAFNR